MIEAGSIAGLKPVAAKSIGSSTRALPFAR
jgi:hypothetical protein